MGTIRVEYVPIKKYNLGLFGLDHLQIVYEDESSFVNKQDNWYVLEGTQEGGLFDGHLGVLGEEITTPLSAANDAHDEALVDLIGTPESRGSRIVYQYLDASTFWQQMMDYGKEIQAQDFPYEGFASPFSAGSILNSSSVVASLLNSIGVDVNFNMPYGIRLSPGTSTLLGTTLNDDIRLAGSFTQAAGGFGADKLYGTETLIWPEKFYGGDDNDTIFWSKGENFVHGGQARLAYALDGTDTIDYSGVGVVQIITGRYPVEHKSPDLISAFDGGSDQLFSIEAVNWFRETDVIQLGQGVELLEGPIKLDLDQSSGGRGDELGFLDTNTPLIVMAVDDQMISIQTQANQGLDAGFWAQSVEWLTGSEGDDRIYAGATLTGVEGGGGNDLLDGRLAVAFSHASPLGYDIELSGGDGNDTIISGAGYSAAAGGAGADRFILSTITSSPDSPVEFVITDAGINDTLYLPYNFFKADRGGFDGSELMQLRGAPFAIDDMTPLSAFWWGPPSDDQEHGLIDFVGRINFRMDGADLVIEVMQGVVDEHQVDYGPGEPPGPLIRTVIGLGDTLTLIRVKDWQDGDLGISFPLTFDPDEFANNPTDEFYPGFNAALNELVNPSIFADALDLRPDAYVPLEVQNETEPAAAAASLLSAIPLAALAPPAATENDDVIDLPDGGPYKIYALGGNDNITGSAGGDVIDGGTGNDTMAGGRGNDVYFVDSAGDHVIEVARGGFDRVYASIDYALPDEVEHLTLTGTAVQGTGNALRNIITGNDVDNDLSGGAGDDVLAGNRGNDTLAGGDGSDGYVYELGDGNDIIVEAAVGDGEDVIVFAGGMTAEDFAFYRNPQALDDLIIRFLDGGSITIAGYFAAAGGTIEGLSFINGETWDPATLQDRAAEAILSSNQAPVARDDAYVFAGANSFALPLAALLDNDEDLDGDALSISGILHTSEGNAILDGDNIIVTAGMGTSPVAIFTYIVKDADGATATATAEISFLPNTAPIITSASLSPVQANASAVGQILATDAENDTLLYAIKQTAAPTRGTVTFSSGGSFTYTPFANETGADSFTVIVSDGFGASAEHTFDLVIAAGNNHASSITSASLGTVLEDTPTAGTISATDTDPGDVLSYSVKSGAGPTKGSIAFGSGGAFTYTPDANLNGPESFTIAVSDQHGAITEQVFAFDIIPVNDAPAAMDDHGFHMRAGTALTIASTLLLTNDSDSDGDPLTITAVGNSIGGTVELNAKGNPQFTAAPGFKGAGHFTYTIEDPAGEQATATVSIAIDDQGAEGTGAVLIGTNRHDVLRGTAYADVFYGKKASDILIGGADNDVFRVNGDDGRDRIFGGSGYDIVRGGNGNDVIRVASHFGNMSGVEEIDGRGGYDRIEATSHADVLNLNTIKLNRIELISLGAGNDHVISSAAREILSGGAGHDTFSFNRNSGKDVIKDFTTALNSISNYDILDLRACHFSSYAGFYAACHQTGGDVVISLSSTSSVTLKNTSVFAIPFWEILL